MKLLFLAILWGNALEYPLTEDEDVKEDKVEMIFKITEHFGNWFIDFFFDVNTVPVSVPVGFNFENTWNIITRRYTDDFEEKGEFIKNENIQMAATQPVEAGWYNLSIAWKDSDRILKGFKLYFVTSRSFEYTDSISLAHEFEDESFSFVHLWYKEKWIKELSFSITSLNKNQMNLTLGWVPKQYRLVHPYHESCSVLSSPQWSCEFSYSYIKYYGGTAVSSKYFTDKPSAIYFHGNSNQIQAPDSYLDFLEEKVFHNYLWSQVCQYDNYPHFKKFTCKCALWDTFPEIIITVNGIELVLTSDIWFENPVGICSFIIVNDKSGDNKWVWNSRFYYKYGTWFNYKMNTISFFSDTSFYVNEDYRDSNSKYICLVTCIFVSIICLVMSLVWFWQLNKKIII